MIVGFFVTALLSCIDAVVSLFPTWNAGTIPTNNGFISAVSELNGVIPIQTMIECLLLALALTLAMRLYDLGIWVWHQFWGSD